MSERRARAAGWALGLRLLFLGVVFGAGPLALRRRHGSTGWLSPTGSTPAEAAAGALYTAGCALDLAGAALARAGALPTARRLDRPAVRAAGASLCLLGAGAAAAAQRAMGASWRTGIDPARPGALVVDGPFALVRNPVYTCMIASAAGSALLAPTPLAPAALAACVAGLELQARAVEEPFLAAVHRGRYRRYAARVGRFLPAIGRLPPG